MNKTKISKSLNVTHSSVCQWLSGATRPTLENMIQLRDKFGIPVDAWLDIKSFITTSSHKNKELQNV
jgi:transcriptional regulator with XRE-family HTH domain